MAEARLRVVSSHKDGVSAERYDINRRGPSSTPAYLRFDPLPNVISGKIVTKLIFQFGYEVQDYGDYTLVLKNSDGSTVASTGLPLSGNSIGASTETAAEIRAFIDRISGEFSVDAWRITGLTPPVYFYSEKSGSPPYMTLVYQNKSIQATQISPENGARVVRTKANVFSWRMDIPAESGVLIGSIAQSSAQLQWRIGSSGAINTINISGSGTSYTVPANTFTDNNIEWRISVTSNGGATSTSGWRSIITDDVTGTTNPISPISDVVNDVTGITFRWAHNISTGTQQSAFEIQTSVDQGTTWKALVNGAGAQNSVTAAHNATPTGSILWRIRTRNSTGQWGTWSAGIGIVVIASPDAPVITYTDSKPRPTIRWTSVNQSSYRVQVGGYDSGYIFGTAKEFKIPEYLSDGGHTVSVTIKNSSGLVSSPGTKWINISNNAYTPFGLRTVSSHNAVFLTWDVVGGAIRYYILRDGVPVGLVNLGSETTYADYFCCGRHTYQIMSVDTNDYYAKSIEVVEISTPVFALISAVDMIDFILLKYSVNKQDTFNREINRDIELVQYSGRSKPESYVSPWATVKNIFRYKMLGYEAYEKLEKLDGKIVLYKNYRNEKVIGLLQVSSVVKGRNKDVSFAIVEVDFTERVSYI